MPSASFLRRLRRWHRGTGLFLLLWVLLVAVTGVALNHSAGLGLDKLRLTSPLLLRLYAIELKEPQGIPVDRHWLSVGGDRQLYLDALAIGHCERLDGAAVTEAGIYAACGDALMVIDRQGRIVERLPPPPTPTNDASRFGLCAGSPCIETGDTQLALDPVHLTWQPTAAALSAPAPNSLPASLAQALRDQSIPAEFSWERLVRDVHSGAVAGIGPWLMDFFALALIFLSLTGIALWFTGRNGKPR